MADYTLSAKITADITGFSKSLKTAQNKLSGFSAAVGNIGNSLKNIGGVLTGAGTKITALETAAAGLATKGLTVALNSAIDFESAFTDVKKTIDGTDKQFEVIKEGIWNMAEATASSATEIAAVASAAGQLGIATDNILDFTNVMVELGDSTNLTAEEAATALAKFANITQMDPDDYEKLGSVIVELGNNCATTESDIVAMATRLAGAGATTGLTNQEILAFAAALSSAGIEAEAGGSAWSKLLKKLYTAEARFDNAQATIDSTGLSLRELQLMESNATADFKGLADSVGLTSDELSSAMDSVSLFNQFASTAGMTAEEFKAAYGKNATDAISAFVSGLNNVESNGQSAVEILESMGLTEVRLSDAILRMASSGDLMTNTLDMANEAWDENSALHDEASQRYETTAAKISQTKATLSEFATTIGDALTPAFRDSLDAIKSVVSAMTDGFKTNGAEGAISGLVNRLNGLANAGGIPAFFSTIAEAIGNVVDKFKKLNDAGVPIAEIAAKVALIGPALIAGGKASSILGSGLSGISGIAGRLGGIFGSVAGEAGGFISWLTSFSDTVKSAKEPLKGFGSSIFSVFSSTGGLVGQFIKNIGSLGKKVQPTLDGLKSLFSVFGIVIYDTFGKLFTNISSVLSGFGGKISGLLSPITSKVMSVFTGISAKLLPVFSKIGNSISTVFTGISAKLLPVFSKIGNSISTVFTGISAKLSPIFSKIGNTFSTVFSGIGGKLGEVFSSVSGVIGKITGAFGKLIPAATSFGGQFTSILMKAFGFGAIGGLVLVGLGLLQQNFGEKIGEILTMVQQKGPQLVTDFCIGITSKIPDLITQGGTLITSFLDTLNLLMPSVISGGADIILALVNGFSLQLPYLLERAGALIITIVQGLTEKLPDILAAGMNVISALVEGISAFLPNLIPAAVDMILELALGLVDNLPALIDSGIQLLTSVVEGIVNALPKIAEKAPEIIAKLATTLIEKGPELIVTAGKLILKLADGLIKAIPKIIEKIPEIISAIKEKFLNTDWAQLGKDIMGLVVDGLKAIVNLAIDGINLIIDCINLIPNVNIPHIPFLAHGTDNFAGGLARINEGGRGELVSLPSGAQVIPHDISQKYAREAAKMNAGYSVEIDYNAIGAAVAAAMSGVDLHTTFEVDSRTVANVVTPYVDRNLGRRAALANRYTR